MTVPTTAAPATPAAATAVRPVIGISLVGPLRVVRTGRVVTPSPPKLRQLLALLAVSAGEVVRLETIVEELWGTEPSERTYGTVQTYVSQLRKLLVAPSEPGEGPPVTVNHMPQVGYRMELGAAAFLDLTRLRRLAGAAQVSDPRAAVAPLRAALALCRGPVLSDVKLGPVLAEQQARLDGDRIAVLNRYLRTQLELGDARAVVEESGRVVAEDSRHEELYANLMHALAVVGQRAEAIELFHRVRRRRVERSGMEPGAVLRAAFERVLGDGGDEPPAVVRAAPGRSAASPAQLPIDPHPFVGFERELAAGVEMLDRLGHDRTGQRQTWPAVLAVVGGPGSGKSAFCAHVAERVSAHFPDGQLYTDLSAGVSEAVAGFLRALRVPEIPDGLHERVRTFRQVTEGRRILVLADNVHHSDDIAWLLPGSASSAVVAAASVRPAARHTTVLELPRLTGRDQARLLALRLGQERIVAEPAAARQLLVRCAGLPLAINAMASLALKRPHWSLTRLAAVGPVGPVTRLELAASVRRCLAGLDEAETEQLGRLVADDASDAALSPQHAGAVLGVAAEEAEQLLERLVEIRLADASVAAEPAEFRYSIDPLYRAVLRAG